MAKPTQTLVSVREVFEFFFQEFKIHKHRLNYFFDSPSKVFLLDFVKLALEKLQFSSWLANSCKAQSWKIDEGSFTAVLHYC